MKTPIALILLAILTISFVSNKENTPKETDHNKATRFKTLTIQIPDHLEEVKYMGELDSSDILQPNKNGIRVSKPGVFLVYTDTIAYFSTDRYEEKLAIKKQEIPVTILEIK